MVIYLPEKRPLTEKITKIFCICWVFWWLWMFFVLQEWYSNDKRKRSNSVTSINPFCELRELRQPSRTQFPPAPLVKFYFHPPAFILGARYSWTAPFRFVLIAETHLHAFVRHFLGVPPVENFNIKNIKI